MQSRVVVLVVALVVFVLGPGVARAATLEPLEPSLVPRPFSAPIDDAVTQANGDRAIRTVFGTAEHPKAHAAATYYTADGTPIVVEVSASYGAVVPDRVQTYVNFLGSRVHGPELAKLTVYIVTPAELQTRFCAPQSLACYIPARQLMVLPGEETPDGQAPLEYVVTHELGHHIAANRDNEPWPAIGYGPKRWATLEKVCQGVAARQYFPADQGDHYYQNPGENWAETYAVLHYPTAPWVYDPRFQPNPTVLQTALADVQLPWKRPRPAVKHGVLSPLKRVARFKFKTTLDGRIRLTLTGPARTQFNLQLLAGGRPVKSTVTPGARDVLTYADCGSRSLEARVVRKTGRGRFSLTIATDG